MRFSGFLKIYLLILALILSGCAATAGDPDDETVGMSVAELYQAAKAKLKSKGGGFNAN